MLIHHTFRDTDNCCIAGLRPNGCGKIYAFTTGLDVESEYDSIDPDDDGLDVESEYDSSDPDDDGYLSWLADDND